MLCTLELCAKSGSSAFVHYFIFHVSVILCNVPQENSGFLTALTAENVTNL